MTAMLRQNLMSLGVFASLAVMLALSIALQREASNWFVETSSDAGFVLNDIELNGLVRTREKDVQAVLDIDSGMPLLAIDLKNLQTRIEALPWIKQAQINRVLPGTLTINVFEREPYALSQSNGQVNLIDGDGVRITNRGLAKYTDLILIVGDTSIADLRTLDRLKAAAPMLASRIQSAVRVNQRRWDLIFKNGIRIKLPSVAEQPYGLEQAWARFGDLNQAHQLLEREISVIDMRLPDRLVVRVTPLGRRKMAGKEWTL